MKTIQPFQFWLNGKIVTATIFLLSCNNDNLINEANFYFALLDTNGNTLTNGVLKMGLPDYLTDWQTNDAAYNWAATQLGLTITGEYVPPVQEIINNQIQSNEQSTSLTNS